MLSFKNFVTQESSAVRLRQRGPSQIFFSAGENFRESHCGANCSNPEHHVMVRHCSAINQRAENRKRSRIQDWARILNFRPKRSPSVILAASEKLLRSDDFHNPPATEHEQGALLSCLCLRIVARRRAKATLFSGSKSVGSD